ncbi:GatB/YqeY domain-containing protein [Clostridium akagii]|uniref:GatB/YqeY domain-containing protein n=1 Tax=Clostridium akagii TaxID=91623 RepID=UPI00047B510A|nr:GatB/YqeY domain-containing protein [Clostridium akagii]
MSLKEKLQQDWKDALKSKDKIKATTISMARAAVLQIEKTKSIKLDDEQIIEVLAKEVKLRRDSLIEFEKGKRKDLVDASNAEIEILMNYLPQQLTEDEIKKLIIDIASEIEANSMKDMGKIMAAIVPKTKGRADGSLVSTLVKEYLSK